MRSCDSLFVIEGWTNLPLLRQFVIRLYGASDDGPLKVDFPADSDVGLSRVPLTRAKYKAGGTGIGMFVPGSDEEALQATKRLVVRYLQGQFANLMSLVLVRDLDCSETSALNQGLAQQFQKLAGDEDATFESLGSGPWLCQVNDVVVGQILIGDRLTPGKAAMEDHILELLRLQPERDPTDLTQAVRSHLPSDPSPKQQVQLAMVKDSYWTAAPGFYERVLAKASDEQLENLADQIQFTELMERITVEQTKG